MPSKTIPRIKLQSDDGQIFEVCPQIYKCFDTINSMVEGPFRTTKVEVVVPVPNVNASSLVKVLEWAEYHMDDESLEEDNRYIPDICKWDRELLQVEKNVLMEVILASDYLGNQRLLDIASKAVIDSITNKPSQNVEDSTQDDDFIAEQQQKENCRVCLEYEADSDSESDGEDFLSSSVSLINLS
nr:S-phase kinase-associated protein 1-like [Aedes albopictus]